MCAVPNMRDQDYILKPELAVSSRCVTLYISFISSPWQAELANDKSMC